MCFCFHHQQSKSHVTAKDLSRLPAILTKEHREILLETMRKECCIPMFTAAYILAHTGMRVSELARMKWQDLDVGKGVLRVRTHKNRQTREIPINPGLISVISNMHVFGGSMEQLFSLYPSALGHEIGKALRLACTKLGWPAITCRALRRAFAEINCAYGMSWITLARIMGFSIKS